MKVLFTCLLFCSIAIGNAQIFNEKKLESKLIEILEQTETVQEMIFNKKIIHQQLKDVDQWALDGKITTTTYQNIELGYRKYSMQMNVLVEQLISELDKIESLHDLKQRKLKKWVEAFNSQFFDELINAKKIYETDFKLALEKGAIESKSKSIIPTLVFIIKFGETLFNSIKNLFQNGELNREQEQQLFELGMHIALKKLKSSLSYPDWDDLMKYEVTIESTNYTPGRSSSEEQYNPTEVQLETASITFMDYELKEKLSIMPISKQIIVGGEKGSSTIEIFATQEPMQVGQRFQVMMKGFKYAYFFYYESEESQWKDPYGKSIIVGGEGKNDKSTTLPSMNQFFEILGDNPYEELLILVSQSPLNDKFIRSILHSSKRGVSFMESLHDIIPNLNTTCFKTNISLLNQKEIRFQSNQVFQGIVPVYIKINKEFN